MLIHAEEGNNVWAPFKFFTGGWESKFKGISHSKWEFQFILGGRYLHTKNKSVFEPTEENPEGQVHEDWGIVSYDTAREKFVFRQFHVEGFVNQYILESISDDGKTFVFVTESVENAPAGTKAKLTLTKIGKNKFYQKFEVAWPNRDYQCFSEATYSRE